MEEKNIFVRIFAPIKWILALINNYFKACLFLLLLYFLFVDNSRDVQLSTANLASIDIHGAIMDARPVLEKIQKLQNDKNIKGVLLHVDSPGGALAPSVELSYAIKELKKTKPVVAYAAGTMASGSYYASVWSDKIYANAGAFVGSIGVIFQSYNVEELAQKIGIKAQTVKAGRYKEAGTFMRTWSEDEKAELNSLIQDSYSLFVFDVAKARGLKVEDKELFADAKVFLASKAKKVKLIDEVGTLNDAKKALEKLSHVENPIWQKQDKFDKMLEKLTNESAKMLINAFYGLKAY